MDQLPPLVSLLSLDAVFRTGSVSAAAALLGRTHSAVSKQLHQLQDHAGITLFAKQGTGIVLTPAGKEFAKVVANALDDLRAGYAALHGTGEQEPVTIAVSATFARAWALPMISRFNADHPNVDVLLRLVGPLPVEEEEGGADIVLSWNRLRSPMSTSPFTVPLGDVHIGPVISPAHPHALKDRILSCGARIHRHHTEPMWDAWSRISGIRVEAAKEISFENSSLVFQAARMGMGLAIAPRFLIEDELESGDLVAPAGFLVFRDGFYARPYDRQGRLSPSAKLFLDWLAVHGRLTDEGLLQRAPLPIAM
jgi:DNA-binding transcriptional LysR family regulator